MEAQERAYDDKIGGVGIRGMKGVNPGVLVGTCMRLVKIVFILYLQ